LEYKVAPFDFDRIPGKNFTNFVEIGQLLGIKNILFMDDLYIADGYHIVGRYV
jgi:hypothetical protein